MTDRLAEFLAGDRPDEVAIYLSDDAVDDPDRLADYGERVDDGTLIVVDGERGRGAFQAATGGDAMTFAQEATRRKGAVDRDLTAGDCPEADDVDGGHAARYTFAFAEEHKPDMEGIYGEGDVIHAYVQCACGTRYSEQWIAEE